MPALVDPGARRVMFQFEPEKTLEALLYVAQRVREGDMYLTLKTLYVADKKSLGRYGRFVTGDWYCAMECGPVGSHAYDIVKFVRGDRPFAEIAEAGSAFRMDGNSIVPLREPRTEWLSKSDIECLDAAIAEMRNLRFRDARDVSHDDAWQATARNQRMSEEAIAETLENGKAVVEYLRSVTAPT